MLRDGDEVKLGGATLVAHLTAGHTRGCTTWTLKVNEGGRALDAVIVGSTNVNPGYRLQKPESYPGIAADYRMAFQVLRSLPCDLFLGSHGGFFDLDGKLARRAAAGSNPFIDPDGYRKFVAEKEQELLLKLEGK